jgi:dynactin-4
VQLLKSEDNLAATREFNHLKAHFEQHLRVNTSPLPSSFLSLSNSGTFGKTIGSNSLGGSTGRHRSPFYNLQLSTVRQQQQQRGLLDDITTYEPLERAQDTESKTLELLMGLQEIDSVSTLAQRNTQLHEQPYLVPQLRPQRTHLRIKRSKRCRTCRHFLIKPEPKAQTIRFKIKLVARNYLPTITITALDTPSAVFHPQHPCMTLGASTQFALKFTNPLYEELTVSLAIPSTAQHNRRIIDEPTPGLPYAVNGSVAIITPHFTISPYNETVEYDDEIFPVDSTHAPPLVGIYNKRNNSTSILVEVIPQVLGEFKVCFCSLSLKITDFFFLSLVSVTGHL